MMSMSNIAHTWCTTSTENLFLSRVLQIIALISSRRNIGTFCLEISRDVFLQKVNWSKAGHLPYVFTFITMFNFELLKISNYSIIIFCSEYFNPRRAMLWNSLVSKDKILPGYTCLKMIYKSFGILLYFD